MKTSPSGAAMAVNKLAFGIALFLLVPALNAQQEQPKETPPRVAPRESTDNSTVRNSSSDAIKPGRALDPADVDILTGKRDREIEASRRPAVSILVGGYGNYTNPYVMNGWGSGRFNAPLLPLTRIYNPLFFLNMPPRGFGRGGFCGGR